MPHLAKLASILAEHSDRRGSQMSSHDDTRRRGGATRGHPGDYEVGYGRPPREHQFKKGEPSRNPKGRPRGAKPAPDLVAALLQPVTIRMQGKERKVSFPEAMIQVAKDKALKGDLRANRRSQRPRPGSPACTDHDHASLDRVKLSGREGHWACALRNKPLNQPDPHGYSNQMRELFTAT